MNQSLTQTAMAAQFGLLGGYVAVVACALLIGWRMPRLRPVAFAAGSVCFTHGLYYVLFLLYPDVLDASATAYFSIAIRYQVLFTVILLLALAVRSGRWRN